MLSRLRSTVFFLRPFSLSLAASVELRRETNFFSVNERSIKDRQQNIKFYCSIPYNIYSNANGFLVWNFKLVFLFVSRDGTLKAQLTKLRFEMEKKQRKKSFRRRLTAFLIHFCRNLTPCFLLRIHQVRVANKGANRSGSFHSRGVTMWIEFWRYLYWKIFAFIQSISVIESLNFNYRSTAKDERAVQSISKRTMLCTGTSNSTRSSRENFFHFINILWTTFPLTTSCLCSHQRWRALHSILEHKYFSNS